MTASGAIDAAVEAGAEALWNWTMNDDPAVQPEPWRLADGEDRQRCTEALRVILEAVTPILQHHTRVADRYPGVVIGAALYLGRWGLSLLWGSPKVIFDDDLAGGE